MPTKSEDNFGVATPDMIYQESPEMELSFDAAAIMGAYKPLTKSNLEEKLQNELETI
jgi:hypothetical protein